MAGFLLRHRKSVATAVAAAGFGLVGTARWAADETAMDGRPWPSIMALVYCAVTAGLFVYLGTDRARDALDEGTDSSVATARIIVALSPTVAVSVLHLIGADVWVMWLVLGTTVAQLIVWSGLSKKGHIWTSRE